MRADQYDKHITITVVAASTTSVATAQTLAGAGAMTLTASPTVSDTVIGTTIGHLVSLTSTGALSGVNFTIVGQDPDGQLLTETIAGPSNSTVLTTNYFTTVTSIAASGAVGTAISAGFAAAGATRRIPIDFRTGDFSVGLAVDYSGTSTVTVQETFTDILTVTNASQYVWYPVASMSAVTASTMGGLTLPCTAVRLILVSFSATPTYHFHVLQNKDFSGA